MSPSDTRHRDQIVRNETLYRGVLNGQEAKYSEWAVTALFYIAVHLVEERLAALGIDSRDHVDRGQQLKNAGLVHAASTLKSLKDTSRDARYLCRRFTPLQIGLVEQVVFQQLPRELR